MLLFRLAAMLPALLVAGAPHSAAVHSGPPFPRIANVNGMLINADSSQQDIDTAARFTLLIGSIRGSWGNPAIRTRLRAKVAALHSKNPHIMILDHTASSISANPKDKSFPQDGWLLQADGKRIDGWPGTQMINLTKDDVIEWLANKAKTSVTDMGMDGVFMDSMGSGFDYWACNITTHAPFTVDANGDGKPDDRQWLNQQWIQAKTKLARRVREVIGPDKLFMANQAGDWAAPYCNGIMLEDYIDLVLDGKKTWDSVFTAYQHWLGQALAPNITTLTATSGVQPPYEAWKRPKAEVEPLLEMGRNRLERMRFGLTTTLMGDGYYAFDLDTRWHGQAWWYPEYDAPLGYPTGDAQRQSDGTWRRSFEGGIVVVNPTKQEANVHLSGSYRDVSSGTEASSFVIPAQDGRIFVK